MSGASRRRPEEAYRVREGARLRLLRAQDVLGRDGPSGVGVRARLRDEDGLAVVAQLRDGLADVRQGAVVAVLLRAVEVRPGVPPAGQLLDGGDVHDPVVEVLFE